MIARMLLTFILVAAALPATAQYPDLVPPGWQLAPQEPGWTGRRYLSPDGSAWLAVYAAPADPRSDRTHIDRITRVEGEAISYHRRARNWLVVSGYKGDRIFYRKSNLACGGTRWHTVALEYPAAAKRQMDALVTRVAHGMNHYDTDCTTGRRG